MIPFFIPFFFERRVAELREAGILHVDHVGLDPLTDTKAEFLAL